VRDDLAAAGVRVQESIAALGECSDIVVIYVYADE
jgi:hypothetical protein